MIAKATIARTAKEYITESGSSPFRDWLVQLDNVPLQLQITKTVTQMEAGNFGDHKPITNGKGLHERRIHKGPGYRIYYIIDGDELIILFGGSDKSNQRDAIKLSKQYLADYRSRKPIAP